MLESLLADQVRARRMALLVSDPPYGISLDSEWREAGERHLSRGLRGVPDGLNSAELERHLREHGASPISSDIAQVADALQPQFAQYRRRAQFHPAAREAQIRFDNQKILWYRLSMNKLSFAIVVLRGVLACAQPPCWLTGLFTFNGSTRHWIR
jgi:hypothetical protein